MKKYVRLSVAIILFAIIVGILLYKMPKRYYKLISFCPQDTHCAIYCKQTTLPNTSVGYGSIVSCNASSLLTSLEQCSQVDGVSFSYKGTEQQFVDLVRKLNVEVHSRYVLQDIAVVCGHTQYLSGGIVVDNKLTNIQLAYNNGTITLGSPLILGEY